MFLVLLNRRPGDCSSLVPFDASLYFTGHAPVVVSYHEAKSRLDVVIEGCAVDPAIGELAVAEPHGQNDLLSKLWIALLEDSQEGLDAKEELDLGLALLATAKVVFPDVGCREGDGSLEDGMEAFLVVLEGIVLGRKFDGLVAVFGGCSY